MIKILPSLSLSTTWDAQTDHQYQMQNLLTFGLCVLIFYTEKVSPEPHTELLVNILAFPLYSKNSPLRTGRVKTNTTRYLLLFNSHWPGQKPKCLPILKIFQKCVNSYIEAKHICFVNQFTGFLKKKKKSATNWYKTYLKKEENKLKGNLNQHVSEAWTS